MNTLRQFYLVLLGGLFVACLLFHPLGRESLVWSGTVPSDRYFGLMGGYNPEAKLALVGIALMSVVIRLVYRERWEIAPQHPLKALPQHSGLLAYDVVLAIIGLLAMLLLCGLVPRLPGGTGMQTSNFLYAGLLTFLVGLADFVATIRFTHPIRPARASANSKKPKPTSSGRIKQPSLAPDAPPAPAEDKSAKPEPLEP